MSSQLGKGCFGNVDLVPSLDKLLGDLVDRLESHAPVLSHVAEST